MWLRSHTVNACLLGVSYHALPVTGQSPVMLWNGVQSVAFFSGISSSCDTALNTTLNCPSSVQWLASGMQAVQWNTSGLSSLCTAGCKNSLATLLTNVQSGCGTESYPFNGGNMTWVEQVQSFQYKYGLVCMKDATTSNFCSDVEAGWNITTMVSQGKATWPQNTTKCYIDSSQIPWHYIQDSNGTCLDPFENVWVDASNAPVSDRLAALDYYYERSAPIDDDNYGWSTPLDSDEYPLEIQCSSCFINKFKYGMTSVWGDAWDEITAQAWNNMKVNCNLKDTIVPANNISFTTLNVDDTLSTTTANLSMCVQLIAPDNTATCQQTALKYALPVAGLMNLNDGIYCSRLTGDTLCGPPSCPIGVNKGNAMSLDPFVQQYSNFTREEFIAWNTFLDNTLIMPGDTVCVGPPGGSYSPQMATQAFPSVYTTTASPVDPTPSGTIKNCGHYYEVQLGDYCDAIALNFSLTFSQLIDMNPALDSACSNLWVGYDYCVAPVNGTSVTHVTSTAAPASSMTNTDGAVSKSTASSTKTATTSSSSKTTSATSKTSSGSSTSSSSAKSTSKSSTTSGTTGSTSSKKSSSTTTSPKITSSTVTTPTPTQTGMASGCTKFYKAISGDTCSAIATKYSITVSDFEAWNPAVGTNCGSIYVDYYYCVGM